MAPFDKCTCCQVRTRKVIRDQATRKNIYVCPTCYRTKKYLQTNYRKKDQPEEDEVLQNDDQTGENNPTANVQKEIPLTCTKTNINSSPKITPPLMEIVIMNNRKYIAVSVTADAE